MSLEDENQLLAALPPGPRARIEEAGQVVSLTPRQFRISSSYMYFPLEGLGSIVARTLDGQDLESLLVGPEGVFGTMSPSTQSAGLIAAVHIPGRALRVAASVVQEVKSSDPRATDVLQRYEEARFAIAAITGACSQHHSAVERVARWLAEAYARTRSRQLPVTQETVAAMLGLRRPTVSVAESVLRSAGALTITRGGVTIEDFDTLLTESCGCYQLVAGLLQLSGLE